MPEKIALNGVDLTTGGYLAAQLDENMLAREILKLAAPAGVLKELLEKLELERFGPPSEMPENSGWGVVFQHGCAADVRHAVEGILVAHRRTHIDPRLVKVFERRPDETAVGWLTRHDVAMGALDEAKIPYYLLLVGGPEQIPYSFENVLKPRYAVGRIQFDTADDYQRYCAGVETYEKTTVPVRSKEIVYWATRYKEDKQTELSEEHLIGKLCAGFGESGSAQKRPLAARCGFAANEFRAENATKTALHDALHPKAGKLGPALLFTASHGLGAPGSADQRNLQGALLCAPPGGGAVPRAHYFCADDLNPNANLSGLVAFMFGCFSAGTPRRHAYELDKVKDCSADPPFMAALPKKMLCQPGGPALAVIGHVDRAWSYALKAPGVSESPIVFWRCVNDLMGAYPVGYAHHHFMKSYTHLSAYLTQVINNEVPMPTPKGLARKWLERNDAQGYAILGDPAIRLRDEAMA